jgi:hypothetical protein
MGPSLSAPPDWSRERLGLPEKKELLAVMVGGPEDLEQPQGKTISQIIAEA